MQAALWWADYDGGSVVLHIPSGKTHFLNQGTSLLLKRVLLVPLDPEAAAHRLAECQNAAFEPRLADYMKDLLSRLEELGLIERVPD